MRGLEERLRLALEGTETGFWEWDVATDAIEWSDNIGPALRPPARHAAGAAARTTSTASSHPEDREAAAPRCVQAALEHGTPYEHDLRVTLPDGGERWLHSRVRVQSRRRRRAPSASSACSPTSPSAASARTAHAFLDAASQALAASLDPLRDARRGRAARRPAARRLVRGPARRRRPRRLRAGRGRPRRPRQGPLGARAAGALPARPGRADRRAGGDPHRPLGALSGDRQRAAARPPRSTTSSAQLVRELQMHSRDDRAADARATARSARSRSSARSPAASTRRASSSWPRSSAAAPGSRSTTRGCSRASTRPRRRSSARCCPPRCRRSPGYELVVRYVAERRARPRRRRLVRRVPAAATGASGS